MHEKVFALLSEKNEGRTIHVIDHWFPLTDLKSFAYVGSFSVSLPSTKERWILDKTAIDINGLPVTPTDLARAYIEVKYGKKPKLRCTTQQYQETVARNVRAPLFSYPSKGKGAYIDLVSAYWSILKIVGWDVDYHPGKYMSVRSSVLDFPYPEIKMARNCLVSLGLSSDMRVWDGDKMRVMKAGNRFTNGVLWALVQDVLNGIAADVVKQGVVYVYSDGYIALDQSSKSVFEAIEAWGPKARIKHSGNFHVRAPAAYTIGGHTSKPFARAHDRTVVKINPYKSEWLRKRMKFWSN